MKHEHDDIDDIANKRAREEQERIKEEHVLILLVDKFASEMKKKLIDKMSVKTDWGWAQPDWPIFPEEEGDDCADCIIQVLKDHVESGDPIDVANFCLFWWNRLSENKNIRLKPDGWYYVDKVDQEHGPYRNEDNAILHLDKYTKGAES